METNTKRDLGCNYFTNGHEFIRHNLDTGKITKVITKKGQETMTNSPLYICGFLTNHGNYTKISYQEFRAAQNEILRKLI